MSTANPVRDEIVSWLEKRLPVDPGEIDGILEIPPDPQMGDFALPCFPLARELRKNPAEIASELADEFKPSESVEEARASGPYLNFLVNRPKMMARLLGRICEEGTEYGKSSEGNGQTIVIDYSSPNIAKHLGVHHLRSAIIGRALYEIFQSLGYECIGINHLGDWGTSFGKLIVAYERYDDLDAERASVTDLQEAYIRFSQEAEETPELEDQAREALKKLENGDPEARALWKRFKEVSLAEFKRIYMMLGIEFDQYKGESFYLNMTDELIDRLLSEEIAEESENAIIVPLEDYDLPPLMLQKRDQTTLYATRDLCAARYRWDNYKFERCLYVVGGEQKLHFEQLRATLEIMGHEWSERIEHVDFGLLKFLDVDTGEARTGSTRQGDIILLEDVLQDGVKKAKGKIQQNLSKIGEDTDLDELAEKVGIGAVVFSDLSVRRAKDVIFDWDRMLDFEGDTGPYVQYAHARLCSILRNAEEEVTPSADCSKLTLSDEWALVRMLEEYPKKVQAAARKREPSVVANYLLELCSQFSTYYSAGMREPARRVLCEDPDVRAPRLLLVDAVRHVIGNGLNLLGVAAPDRM